MTSCLLPVRTVGAAGRIFGRLASRPARLLLGIVRGAQQKALAFSLGMVLAVQAFAATPPNTAILNTASANYAVSDGVNTTPFSVQGAATLTTAACSTVGIKVELMQYIPPARAAQAPANAVNEWVQPAAHAPGGTAAGPFVALPGPVWLGTAAPATLPANLLLAPVNDAAGKPVASYARNEPVVVRVVSYDANVNGAAADQVVVTITTSSGDSEVLQLTETGPSTGVFVGAIGTTFVGTAGTITQNDGQIGIPAHNEAITATYIHSDCAAATFASSSSGLIDPYGIVFDSSTGAPVNGAVVTLIDTATNLPAVVFCDDGVTTLPQPVTTGAATVCDAALPAGGFRFPQVAAGNYRLQVATPAGQVFPSAVPLAGLPALVGVPAAAPVILGAPGPTPGGSYGGVFSLWGPALKIDIPVDAGGTALTIQKTAGKSVAGIGEFVPYTLSITNNTGAALAGVQIVDRVPPGFRYRKGSAMQDGVAIADPVVSADAAQLTFNLAIGASASSSVQYVLEVTAAAHPGMAENTVRAANFTSNTGRARVLVREDLFRTKPILIGRVLDVSEPENAEFADPKAPRSACDLRADNDFKGMPNARVVLQDGTYVLSDAEGRWHVDNLRAGTHVVQLDLDSLPEDYEVVQCADSDRFAGRRYSQFVNLRGGSLWRADFHVRKKPAVAKRLMQTLSAQAEQDDTVLELKVDGSTQVTGYTATLMLPEGVHYVPGSTTLNGQPAADPEPMENALIFRSLAHPAQWQEVYRFKVADVGPRASFQSMLRFTPPGRPAQNAPVVRLTMLNHAPVESSSAAEVRVEKADLRPAKTPLDDDPARLMERLPYDEAWLAATPANEEWLHPQESFHPNLPVMMVAVKHLPKRKLELSVNGDKVDELAFDGTRLNAARSVGLSTWRGVRVKEGDNRVELVMRDETGREVRREVRTIHYAATPDRIEFLPQQSRLLADGKTRPIIALRLLDKAGVPVRRGINGEFQLNEPYRSYDRREGIEREPLAGRIGGKPRFEVKTDGIALIELEPTTQTGEAVLTFQFGDARTQEIRAWLEPGQRDWILVGFAEGTLAHKTLSSNISPLDRAELDRQLFDGNKAAFYAKGSIKGEYLLTVAYDTSKDIGDKKVKQAIDPTQYYTLYADATQAQYDAASSSRLYLKLERKQFYALFGDYDTGLTVTELARYSRTLTGVKSEFKGEQMGYSAFASVTEQAYIKDEIQGNGTSGLYRLSRQNIVINSDKLRIETRDRFQSHVIVSSKLLTRYLDYDIDYALGTVNFREPVQSRDGDFNPTWIVAEYESADRQDARATFGGRGSFKPTAEIELGATAVHEGTVGATGNLTGLDATYKLGEATKLRAEFAASDRNVASNVSNGNAWLAEALHHEEVWDGKVYLRQQGGGFGIGQQAPSEFATRKWGGDGRYKLDETTQVKGQVYRQDNLTTGANNLVLDARVDEKISETLNAYLGGRTSRDSSAAGLKQSNQLLAGAAYTSDDRKLTLRASGEAAIGAAESLPMPNRLILGSDYKLTEQTKAFAEQEFARGEQLSANTTRVGLRTQPWQGAEMAASVGNNFNNDAERLYANLGMVQRWQIDEHWQTDFSVDRSQTLKNTAAPLNPNMPLPSGSMPPAAGYTGDFTAFAIGGGYNDTLWSGNARVEVRRADLGNQNNLQCGLQRNLDEGRSVAVGYLLHMLDNPAQSTASRNADLRLSLAYRPNDSEWVWLNRADFITQTTSASGSVLKGDKLVNNFNANWMPTRRTQLALQYGAKYVLDTVNNTDYTGYTDLIGVEVRHDLDADWDVGAAASVMRSVGAGVRSYAYGASLGYKVMDNMWLAAGYNLRGMDDRDFAGAGYRGQGPYLTLRMKVDQDTFGLNDGAQRTRPLSGE